MSLGKSISHFLRAGAALLALVAVAACAGGPKRPPGGGPSMRMGGADMPSMIVRPGALLLAGMDANGDLLVSGQELDAGIGAAFARADGDGSGGVSPIEFANWSIAALGTNDATPGRLSFDTTADGAITRAEFDAGMRALFAQFDADKNGAVSRAEMVQRLQLPERMGPGGGGPGGGGRPGGRGGPGGGPGG